MTGTNPRAIAVAQAIKQSFEINAQPGSSVNAHPNAFFLNVLGAVDLLKAAELAVSRLDAYDTAAKKRAEEVAATSVSASDSVK